MKTILVSLALLVLISSTYSESSSSNQEERNQQLVDAIHRQAKIEEINRALEQGADVNAKGFYGNLRIHYYARQGEVPLNYEGSLEQFRAECGSTPLVASIVHRCYDVFKLLIAQGADIHKPSYEGILGHPQILHIMGDAPPLTWAAFMNEFKMYKLLVEHGADTTMENYEDPNPLFLAATSGNKAICELLLSHGSTINVKLKDKEFTPLMATAQHGHEELCNYFIEQEANIHAQMRPWRSRAYQSSLYGAFSDC